MNIETFQLSQEQQFTLSAQAMEIKSATVEAIRDRLIEQMKILIYQDNAIRSMIKRDRQSNPLELSDAQRFEFEVIRRAALEMDKTQATDALIQALRISQCKRNVIQSLDQSFRHES